MRVRPFHVRPDFRLALGLALAAAGCGGPQAGQGYPGDPVEQLSGSVSGGAALFDVRFVWQQALPPAMTTMQLEQGASSYKVPAGDGVYGFQTMLFRPPPDGVFLRFRADEVAFARGNTITTPQGMDPADLAQLPGSQNPAFSADLGHWLLYVQADVPSGSLTEWWLHGQALPAGFHVVRVDVPHCLSAQEVDDCAAAVVLRGLADDGTYAPGKARAFCAAFAPYRVTPADGEASTLTLGTYDFPDLACQLP